jgi:hypothetical protein
MTSPNSHLDPLIRRLESVAPVSDAERQAIAALPITVRDLRADQDILRDQDRPSQCCVILEGFRATFPTCKAFISRSWTITSGRSLPARSPSFRTRQFGSSFGPTHASRMCFGGKR